MPLRILHTNDLHGKLTPEKAQALAPVRQEHDLYFDSGDGIKAGNLALPLGEDPAWAAFAELGVDAQCPGNRESHVLKTGVAAKFRGRQHPILCANWRTKKGDLVWEDHLLVEREGVKVGVFGVMVAMVTERMKTKAASHYLWDKPIRTAKRKAQELRPQCDLLIALTHIGIKKDQRLAEECPEIDIIFGGHSHTVLEQPEGRICQGGSHGRFYGSYTWSKDEGLAGGLHAWP